MILSTGVGSSVALAKLKEMRDQIKSAATGRNGVSAAERALRFSFKVFDALPKEEQRKHSWKNCTICSKDVVACRLLGVDMDTVGPGMQHLGFGSAQPCSFPPMLQCGLHCAAVCVCCFYYVHCAVASYCCCLFGVYPLSLSLPSCAASCRL